MPPFHGVRSPVVIVSSVKAAHAFLTATPADARGIASALIVAADQADTDAGITIVQDNTPEWLAELATAFRVPAEIERLRAELDTVTAERDNALAELATLPDEGYADAHRAPVDLNAMRAKLAAKAPKCTCEYPYEVAGLGHHPGCELSH